MFKITLMSLTWLSVFDHLLDSCNRNLIPGTQEIQVCLSVTLWTKVVTVGLCFMFLLGPRLQRYSLAL